MYDFPEGRSGDGAGESRSLHAVCSSCVRMAAVRLLQPAHGRLQTQRRLVGARFPSSSRVQCRNALTDVCFSCRSRHEEYDLVGGDHLGCHFTSILQSTGLQYRDFIHISFHNQVTSRGLAPRVRRASERLRLCLSLCRSTRSRFSWRWIISGRRCSSL